MLLARILPTFSNSLLAWQLRLLKNILSANAFMSRIVTVTAASSSIRLLKEIQKYFYWVKGYWRIVNRVILAWSWQGYNRDSPVVISPFIQLWINAMIPFPGLRIFWIHVFLLLLLFDRTETTANVRKDGQWRDNKNFTTQWVYQFFLGMARLIM